MHCRGHNRGDLRKIRICELASAKGKAVHHEHHQVQHGDVTPTFFGRAQRFETVARGRDLRYPTDLSSSVRTSRIAGSSSTTRIWGWLGGTLATIPISIVVVGR